jgi:hypothetical protein
MKHRYYAILGLLFLASLTACGTDGVEIETYRDPETDLCYVEVHENISGDNDRDAKYAIPCLITEVEAP